MGIPTLYCQTVRCRGSVYNIILFTHQATELCEGCFFPDLFHTDMVSSPSIGLGGLSLPRGATLSALHSGGEAARISPECGDVSESGTIYACKATDGQRWITPQYKINHSKEQFLSYQCMFTILQRLSIAYKEKPKYLRLELSILCNLFKLIRHLSGVLL